MADRWYRYALLVIVLAAVLIGVYQQGWQDGSRYMNHYVGRAVVLRSFMTIIQPDDPVTIKGRAAERALFFGARSMESPAPPLLIPWIFDERQEDEAVMRSALEKITAAEAVYRDAKHARALERWQQRQAGKMEQSDAR